MKYLNPMLVKEIPVISVDRNIDQGETQKDNIDSKDRGTSTADENTRQESPIPVISSMSNCLTTGNQSETRMYQNRDDVVELQAGMYVSSQEK